ncbi:MAG: histidine kinase [Bacteroidota bacterium]
MTAVREFFNNRVVEYSYPYNNPWWRLGLNVGAAVLIPLYFLFDGQTTLYFKVMFLIFTNDFLQAVVHVYIYARLDEKYDWIKQPWQRTIWGIVYHILATIVVYFLVSGFDIWLLFDIKPVDGFFILLSMWYIPAALIPMVLAFSVAGEFWKNWKAAIINEEKLKAEMMSYKYESLKNQVNPHFLFNSFNVLLNLVDQDQETAKEFIRKLSQLYRNVLEVGDNELIPLKDELEFINSYIFLLKIRFEEKLQVTIDLSTQDSDMVVPMVLQTLVENAVKHNAASREVPLKISIYRENDRIYIVNNLNIIQLMEKSSQKGLKNIRQRYAFFSSEQMETEQTSDEFRVSIPILKLES